MRRRRVAGCYLGCTVRRAFVIASCLGVLPIGILGCSEETTRPHGLTGTGTSTGGQGGSGAAGGSETGGGGQGAAAGGGGDGASAGAGGEGAVGGAAGAGGEGGQGGGTATGFGQIQLVFEPDTACASTSAVPATVYPGIAEPPALDRLEAVGARWLANDSMMSLGYVTFDADGGNATVDPLTVGPTYNLAASEGTTVGVAGATSSQIFFSRADQNDSLLVAPLVMADENPDGLMLASGGGESVVVWGADTTLRARGIDSLGVYSGPAFDFGAGSLESSIVGSGTYASPGFAVAWTSLIGGVYRTSFATLTTTAAGSVVTVVETPTPHWPVKLDRIDGIGYALLFNAELPIWTPILVVLDDTGAVQGSGHVLVGADTAYDMSVRGTSDIGIIAQRDSNETEFRSADLTGTPLGPWVCLNGTDMSIAKTAAVAGSGSNYFMLYRQPDQTVVLIQTDRFGSIAR